MNYVDDAYIIDELCIIHQDGHDIEVNWLSRRFQPADLASPRLKKSIGYWGDHLKEALASQNVDLERLSLLHFVWTAVGQCYMQATDDRGKLHKIKVMVSNT